MQQSGNMGRSKMQELLRRKQDVQETRKNFRLKQHYFSVTRQGQKGLCVHLPKTWAETLNITFGDELAVVADNKSITFTKVED